MDNRKWEADAAGTPPTPPVAPSEGYPTNGNPTTPVPATEPGDWLWYSLTEEIRNVILEGGLTPDITSVTQLRDAINAIALQLTDFTDSNQLLATTGYQKLPGGLILQWVTGASQFVAAGTSAIQAITLPVTFPNGILRSFSDVVFGSGGGCLSAVSSDSTSSVSVLLLNINTGAHGTHTPTAFAIGY